MVQTNGGYLRGVHVKTSKYDYWSFKGVPYGAPPIGALRFKAPKPHKGWNGVRNATEHGSFCANKFGVFGVPGTAGGSEDCLFLNVYTPSLAGNRAVMFWIHGGGFLSGSGDSWLYGPGPLVKRDVVVVTINYRLSAFGFLSTNDKFAPGNQGIMDMVLALKWVQNNIKRFGGDPKKVTIFGESAGGTAAHLLMLSDKTEHLFHQTIIQSGTAFIPFMFQPHPKFVAENFGRRLGLTFNSSEELVTKLKHLDYKKLIEAEAPYSPRSAYTPTEFVPSVDRFLLMGQTPLEIMLSEHFRKIPMMIGNNNMEGLYGMILEHPDFVNAYNNDLSLALPPSFNLHKGSPQINVAINAFRNLYFGGNAGGNLFNFIDILSDGIYRYPSYRTLRLLRSNSNQPIFLYEFSFDGSLNVLKKAYHLEAFPGASHADDLLYLFDTDFPGFTPDATSALVRRRMTKMWTNFAKFG